MIWIFLVLAIIVGLLKGGKFKRLGNLNFRLLWIFILALILQYLIVLFGGANQQLITKYVKEVYIASYVLLFIGLIINIKNKPLIIVLLGTLSNFIAFILNDGKIPVLAEGLKLIGMGNIVSSLKSGELILYTNITDATQYGFLGQIITVPKPFPFPAIFSIGDLIIGFGLYIFIESTMTNPEFDRSGGFVFKR